MKPFFPFFFLLFSLPLYAAIPSQPFLSSLFTSMPDSLLPLLTERNRHDMVDFYHNHIEAKVRNRLNDYARLDTLTDDYLRLTLSRFSTLEMKLLQTTDSLPFVCLVRTIAAPARESHVEFYDTLWHRLYGLELPVPATRDYFSAVPDSLSYNMDFAQRSIDDLRLVQVTLSPSAPVVTFHLSTDELDEDEKRLARRFVRTLRYRWTGSDFVRDAER